jgi:hypothetical protein
MEKRMFVVHPFGPPRRAMAKNEIFFLNTKAFRTKTFPFLLHFFPLKTVFKMVF